jgi:hypothetical protein
MMGGQGNMGSYKQSDWLAEEEQLSTGAGWTFINLMMSPIPTSHVFFFQFSPKCIEVYASGSHHMYLTTCIYIDVFPVGRQLTCADLMVT